MELSALLTDIYRTLREAFGYQDWWPAQTAFEVMVGAVLTQRTNWSNVEKALSALKAAGLMEPGALAEADLERLQSLIRPAGYYRQKSRNLLRLVQWFVARSGGDIASLERVRTDELRAELLSLRGIGPETADSILLYGLGRPTFVVDAYTKRAVVRHSLLDAECTYEELKELFEGHLPRDVELYQDFHAQLVQLGKRYCRPRPLCSMCPLHPLLGDPTGEA